MNKRWGISRSLLITTIALVFSTLDGMAWADPDPSAKATGVIEGQVFTGDSFALGWNVHVFAVTARRGQPILTSSCDAKTDAQGRYRCDQVTVGKYLIAVSITPSLAGVPNFTFYPSGTDLERAVFLDVGNNDHQIANIVLSFRGLYQLSGYIEGSPAHPDISLKAIGDRGFEFETPLTAHYAADGTFKLPNVPPGRYRLDAGWFDGPKRMTSSVDIDVNTDIPGLDLRPLPPTTVMVETHLQSPIHGQLSLTLENVHSGLKSALPLDNPSGIAQFAQQSPGVYLLSTAGDGSECISSLSMGGRELSNPFSLDGQAESVHIQADIGATCGRIQGRVATTSQAHVILTNDQLEVVREIETTQNGEFLIQAIPLSSYRLFAWPTLEAIPYRSLRFLQNNARCESSVEAVKDGGSKLINISLCHP